MSDRITARLGDSREVLKEFPDNHFDSCVTDPPYALTSIVKRFGKVGAAPAQEGSDGRFARASAGFMGQKWDTGETAFDHVFWAEVLRVMKPGAHLAAFSGTRTYHRMAVAIEDAGFDIRDQIGWTYGSGFPKSHDISKGIDRSAGHWRGRDGAIKPETVGQSSKGTEYERAEKGDPVTAAAAAWEGWGTAIKPAWEPICLARKPLSEKTVAANVLRWRTGALNIDGCRVDGDGAAQRETPRGGIWATDVDATGRLIQNPKGRWPANIVHDGSPEVLAAFPADGESSASRFFYTAKAGADDRLGSGHPTVKPVDLMQWLCRLITPPAGLVLEPFAGTGTTGEAAFREGFHAVLIEREAKFHADIMRRISLLLAGPDERARETIKAKIADGRIMDDPGPLFGGTNLAQAGRQAGRQIYGHFADQDERLALLGSSGE